MTTQAQELAERLRAFNEEVIAFVQSLSEEEWRRTCESEKWSVGVVARHVGVGHYASIELAKMIVAGQAIPDFGLEQISSLNEAHALKHADCSKEEVLSILDKKGRKMVDYVAGLSDEELHRSNYVDEFGGDIAVGKLLETINLQSAAEHLASMRRTVAQKK
jgi:hypothetical protein